MLLSNKIRNDDKNTCYSIYIFDDRYFYYSVYLFVQVSFLSYITLTGLVSEKKLYIYLPYCRIDALLFVSGGCDWGRPVCFIRER